MKILWNAKDGGEESRVWCWGFESKLFGSIILLKFGEGSRDAFHTHAFNSLSWVLTGALDEMQLCPDGWMASQMHYPSGRPVITRRETFHRVFGVKKANWVITLRSPWVNRWREFLPGSNRHITLTHGRKEV